MRKLTRMTRKKLREYEDFWNHNVYLKGSYDREEDYAQLNELISAGETETDNARGKHGNRLFYLALPAD